MDWLYGRNVAKQLLAGGTRRRLHRLAGTPQALTAVGSPPPGLPVQKAAARELDELCGSREHQGVAVQAGPFHYAPEDRVLGSQVLVVLDEVSDPHNLGAVARSALAAGARGLVVPRHRSAAVTPAAVKASAGALELLPVAQVTNVVSFLKQAKERGFWVYGAAGEVGVSYLDLDLTGHVVLVFGAEGRGLRPLVARTCDALAAVPLAPEVESLNVSVAAALFLFEARRQTASLAPTTDASSSDSAASSPASNAPSPASAAPPAAPARRRGGAKRRGKGRGGDRPGRTRQ